MIPTALLLRQIRNATKDVGELARRAAIKAKGPLTCFHGCAECCFQKIIASTREGAIIYLYLRATGRWTPEMRARLVEHDREMTAHTHAAWLAARRPCPFLAPAGDGRGLCTVYEVRPVSCATTFSTAGDPRLCSVVGGRGTFAIWLGTENPILLRWARLALDLTGAHHLNATLPGAVLLMEAAIDELPAPAVRVLTEGDDRPRDTARGRSSSRALPRRGLRGASERVLHRLAADSRRPGVGALRRHRQGGLMAETKVFTCTGCGKAVDNPKDRTLTGWPNFGMTEEEYPAKYTRQGELLVLCSLACAFALKKGRDQLS